MAQSIQKVCRVCGVDVAKQKRTKDAAGNYYCQACYEHATSNRRATCVCPGCRRRVGQDEIGQRGVCKECVTVRSSTTVSPCADCGASIGEDAAFCARCGAKQDGRLSANDEVDVTTVIGHLKRYAELNLTFVDTKEVEDGLLNALMHGIANGDDGAHARVTKLHADATAGADAKEGNLLQCHEIKQILEKFDRKRVMLVRDMFLQNEKVDEATKLGLRRDVVGIFGESSAKPAATHPNANSHQTSAPQTRSDSKEVVVSHPPVMPFKSYLKYCSISFGVALALIILLGLIGFDGLAFGFGVLLFCIGIPTALIGYFAVRGTRKVVGVSNVDTKVGATGVTRQSKSLTPADQLNPKISKRFPYGLCVCVGTVLVGTVLIFIAGKRVYDASPPSNDDIHFVTVTGLVGIAVLIIGIIGWSNACPKCLLLFTSEVLNSESLGSHMETRRESRVARHFDARGGPVVSETRYDVDVPVQVTTMLHTKHCKSCGHVWLAKEQRQN